MHTCFIFSYDYKLLDKMNGFRCKESYKQAIFFVLLLGLFLFCFHDIRSYRPMILVEKRNDELQNPRHDQQLQPQPRTGVNEDGCRTKDTQANGAFCMSKSKIYNYRLSFDSKLCSFIETMIETSSIVDFGAGLGYYGRCFLRQEFLIKITDDDKKTFLREDFEIQIKRAQLHGTQQSVTAYEGYDGATNVEEITYGLVKPIDLAVPFTLVNKFDWVMCLEVGEHIPNSAEEVFLKNLVDHACKGIVLSWAVPGQPGLEHINNHPNSYVIEKLEARGFMYDAETTINMRDTVRVVFFKDTLMVFRRTKPIC